MIFIKNFKKTTKFLSSSSSSSMEKSNADNFSILMFPWLGHGHISPYLELAKKLTTRNFTIFLCSTPANLTSVRSKLNEKHSQSIHLVELHLPSLPDLPSHYHTTNGLPSHLMDTLKEAFDMSFANFSDIIKNRKPDLLLYDLLQPWAAEAAFENGIPAVNFVTSGATMSSVSYHSLNFQGVKFPFESTIYFREYESALAKRISTKSKGTTRVMKCIKNSSDIILMKSFKEIEGKYIEYLSTMTGKKVVPVGHLVQDPILGGEEGDDDCEILKWLNKKEKCSTIFVSFGSEYFLSKKDMVEIAHGLELCGANFIWVVRFPKGENGVSLEEALPEGFLERVGDRGKVVYDWASQTKILVHPNTGGFVSHCGWNSVLEGMKFGVPIIAMPMHLDQPVNARLITEVGVGIEVLRDSEGSFDRVTMAQAINKVVKDESGEGLRKKAKELSEKIEVNGDVEIDEVVKELVQLCVMENMIRKFNHEL